MILNYSAYLLWLLFDAPQQISFMKWSAKSYQICFKLIMICYAKNYYFIKKSTMNFSFKNLSISYFFIQNSSSKWNHCSKKKNGLGLPILLKASSVSKSTSSLIFAIQLIISLNIFVLGLSEKCTLDAFFLLSTQFVLQLKRKKHVSGIK